MKKTNQELRAGHKIQVRARNGKRVLTGYAIVFAPAVSEDLGSFVESISYNAVNLEENNVWMLRGHDNNRQLGSTDAGTLRLTKDSRGVRFELDIPDTTDGSDLAELYGRGDGGQCSFGFTARDDNWTQRADGTILRTVTDLQLLKSLAG
jgi:hypothetical protein